jgi:GntR family transcriptional regulator/MocR family aminotransferase
MAQGNSCGEISTWGSSSIDARARVGAGVSRGTVSEAWEQLVAEGYFETAQGSGTFVCQELPETLGVTPRVRLLKPVALKPGTETRMNVKLSRYGMGLNRDFRRPRPAPGVIAFLPGIPDCDHFPFALWRRLLARHLRDATPAVFDYAEGSAGHRRCGRRLRLTWRAREL